MTKRLWLVVAGTLVLAACWTPSAPECQTEKGSNSYNPCSPIDEPPQGPAPRVGDPT